MLSKEANIIKALLKHCKGRRNPKDELNGVLVSGKKLVCTDTKQLLVLEFEENFTDESLNSPVMLCENKKDLVRELERPADYLEILDKNKSIIDEIGFRLVQMGKGKFPDFNRVLIKADAKPTTEEIDSLDCEITFCECIKLTGAAFSPKTLLKFIEIASKLTTENVVIKQKDRNSALQIEGVFALSDQIAIGFKYVAMPICY